jgi:hypothetical protein
MKKSLAILLLCLSLPMAMSQTIDGRIDPGEYAFESEFGGGEHILRWRIQGDTVVFAMEGKTSGWVALGIDPEQVMDQADMIFGWVTESGEAQVVDTFSTGQVGPHPPDTELGGSADVLEFAGTENDGVTTIEFSRRLSTGDNYDKDVPKEGTLKVIWAYGDSDDFEDYHTAAGYGTLDMAAPGGPPPIGVYLFWGHVILMSLSFLLMLTGMFIAKSRKRFRGWLKLHRPMGIVGAITGAAGVVLAGIMVSFRSGVHLRVPHASLGLVTIIVIIATPILGQAFLKLKKGKQALRTIHRWIGRLSLTLMLAVIILGLFQAGIL